MLTLGLDFSSPIRSAAVWRAGAGTEEVLASLSDGGSRAMAGLELVDRTLQLADMKPDAVERIVVGLGPGSYTGIRSAIAIAQGWQLARATRLQGVSSVDCLSCAAQAAGVFGRVSIAIDAQRGEVYLATYQISRDRRELLAPLRLAPAGEILSTLSDPDAHLAGPEASRWAKQGRVLMPEAKWLRWISPVQAGVLGEELEPIYLRETAFVKAPPGTAREIGPPK